MVCSAEHGNLVALLRERQELLTKGMRRLQLSTDTIVIPQTSQDGKKLIGVFQVFTELPSVRVGLPNFRSCETFRRTQRCC